MNRMALKKVNLCLMLTLAIERVYSNVVDGDFFFVGVFVVFALRITREIVKVWELN